MSQLRKGVRGGTESGTGSPLCKTCRNANLRQGAAESQIEVFCNATYPTSLVRFPVFECSEYDKKSDANMQRMEDSAWILRSNPKQKGQLGFYSPQEMKKIKEKEDIPW